MYCTRIFLFLELITKQNYNESGFLQCSFLIANISELSQAPFFGDDTKMDLTTAPKYWKSKKYAVENPNNYNFINNDRLRFKSYKLYNYTVGSLRICFNAVKNIKTYVIDWRLSMPVVSS